MKVCIIYCSIPDPSSDNEMHVIHKDESKCVPKINDFECPTCTNTFKEAEELESHMNQVHEQVSSLSLVSETSSTSWMFVKCNECSMTFQNELDLKNHQEILHSKKIPYTIEVSKRIKQNPHHVNFKDDSDDNDEYLPTNTEIEALENDDEEIMRVRPKRKIVSVVSPLRKKAKKR